MPDNDHDPPHELRLDAKWRADLDAPGAPLLNRRESANYLRIAPGTLRAMERRGELPPTVSVGGREMFRRSDLDRFIAGSPAPTVETDEERAWRMIDEVSFR